MYSSKIGMKTCGSGPWDKMLMIIEKASDSMADGNVMKCKQNFVKAELCMVAFQKSSHFARSFNVLYRRTSKCKCSRMLKKM